MRYCVLVAGVPASGKTTFALHAAKALNLPMVSKDTLKEILYDNVGFATHDEKIKLSIAATQLLMYYAESMMKAEKTFILENNFENVTKPGLQNLMETYRYHPVTVRFGGEVRVIYQRYLQRDLMPDRHGGHKTNDAWPQQEPGVLNAPPGMEAFISEVSARGIADFSVGGEEIYVDATDFSRVSYEGITEEVRRLVGRFVR